MSFLVGGKSCGLAGLFELAASEAADLASRLEAKVNAKNAAAAERAADITQAAMASYETLADRFRIEQMQRDEVDGSIMGHSPFYGNEVVPHHRHHPLWSSLSKSLTD